VSNRSVLSGAANSAQKPLQAREAGERPRDAKKKSSESSKKKHTKKKNKKHQWRTLVFLLKPPKKFEGPHHLINHQPSQP
jgi:hypothetical protein